uniref:DDHD domain-containing protein n=1 Tax=Clastoptera arizonana TaxID=38151 RepID=A0A1B6CIH6_9HEMI
MAGNIKDPIFNSTLNDDESLNLTIPDSSLNLDDDNSFNLGFSDAQLTLEDSSELSTNLESLKLNESNSELNEKAQDEVIDVLRPEQVRWFYKNLSDKHWVEFNGYDSLQIEKKYQDLSSEEWKYYNQTYRSNKLDVSQTASVTNNALKDDGNLYDSSSAVYIPQSGSPNSSNAIGIVVRGGLYEVDLLKKNCSSIFWPGEETVITRGTWFYESWQPLEQEVSDVLEKIHLSHFIGKKNSDYEEDTKAPKKVVHTEVLLDANVDWYAPLEVYLYSHATPSKIVRSFTQRLGGYFQKKSGSRLLRGYKDLATDTDRPKDITHLVFVVHGIGQKMDIGGRILHNTALIRQNLTTLHNRLFPNSTQRAEFFPVEWRTSLTLDGGLVEAITPLHLTQLRNILNSSAMDIMYYTSPIYCAEIQRGLIYEINRLYAMFVERNPNHSVKVSIVGHSLGCVLVYDIITGWLPTDPTMENNGVEESAFGKSRLNFHVDNMFFLGSPLAVFLALRFPKGQHGYHLFPPSLCNRVYNIFHISDPVAYRLEPLVIKGYSRIAPLKIWPCNHPFRIPYCDMPLELIDSQDKESFMSNNSTTSPTPKEETPSSPSETPVREKSWSIWNLMRGGQNRSQDGTASPHQMDSPTRGLEHRLDYIIKVSGTLGTLGSSARSYLNMLSCHTSYWNNEDVAFFILTRLFPELDEAIDDTASVVTEDKSDKVTIIET